MSFKSASVLIVDDDADILTALRLLLKTEVSEIVTEHNPDHLPALLSTRQFDVILLDMNFKSSVNTGNEGFYWLHRIRALKVKSAVIMITAYADIDLAIRAIKEGAFDFVVKPWDNEKLLATLKDAIKGRRDKKNAPELTGISIFDTELLGKSEIMQDIFYKVRKIAPTDANVLILGENGTGKELIAKAIHQYSDRSQRPFVKVDVGALTESLFESELFGHKKGAFTDAKEDRAGRFETADTGTLFLDEMGNISLQQQAKLLGVLQNRQVSRLGSGESIPIDIRLICATNLPLSQLANEQRFRKDLIYRINTIEITLPPLRRRGADILMLAQHFSKVYCNKYMKPPAEFEESAIEKLMAYQYPGNVRELQYTIERAVIMSERDALSANDIIFSPIESDLLKEPDTRKTNLQELERSTIIRVIEEHKGNISRAAKQLGITRTALYRRLNKYDI